MNKFEMLFDNGGGMLLLTDSYCHSYDRPTWAAYDVASLLEGESTEDWDGNQSEYRRDRSLEDDILTMTAAQQVHNGEAWGGRGATWNEFHRELAKLGQDNRERLRAAGAVL